MSKKVKITLERREVVRRILKDRDDSLVVTGLGAPTWDCAAVEDHPNNFYLWGGMGGAAMVGLGLAMAQPQRRVLVITGDGELLMGLGSLATIGVQQPKNLAIIVIDNEHYGETGMQRSHTAFGVDLVNIAAATGFRATHNIYTQPELAELIPTIYKVSGPTFTNIKVTSDLVATALPPRDGTFIKYRFRQAVLGDKPNE